jgi:hypothetical protein
MSENGKRNLTIVNRNLQMHCFFLYFLYSRRSLPLVENTRRLRRAISVMSLGSYYGLLVASPEIEV